MTIEQDYLGDEDIMYLVKKAFRHLEQTADPKDLKNADSLVNQSTPEAELYARVAKLIDKSRREDTP